MQFLETNPIFQRFFGAKNRNCQNLTISWQGRVKNDNHWGPPGDVHTLSICHGSIEINDMRSALCVPLTVYAAVEYWTRKWHLVVLVTTPCYSFFDNFQDALATHLAHFPSGHWSLKLIFFFFTVCFSPLNFLVFFSNIDPWSTRSIIFSYFFLYPFLFLFYSPSPPFPFSFTIKMKGFWFVCDRTLVHAIWQRSSPLISLLLFACWMRKARCHEAHEQTLATVLFRCPQLANRYVVHR